MADNRVARGIVLVPCLLLGGAFGPVAPAVASSAAEPELPRRAAGVGAAGLAAREPPGRA